MKKKYAVGLLAFAMLFMIFAPLRGQTAHSITLTFSDSCATCSFIISRSTTTGGPYTQIGTAPAAATTYVDTTGTGGTKYFYVVQAVDTAGDQSGFSNEVNALAIGNPPAPALAGAVSK